MGRALVTAYPWDEVRAHFDAAAASAETDAEPEHLDPADVAMSEWSEHRAEMGLGGHDTGDWIGLSDDRSGMPDWRHPVQPEQVEPTDLDRHITVRAAAGIKTASSVFGATAPQPRSNASPWSI